MDEDENSTMENNWLKEASFKYLYDSNSSIHKNVEQIDGFFFLKNNPDVRCNFSYYYQNFNHQI